MKSNNIGLVDGGYYPILWYKLRCCKLPRPRTPRRRHYSQILVWTLFCPLAPSLWCPTPAVIYEKYRGSSTSSVALICKLASLLGVEL